jgi:uncharacterized protein (DUF488 family)
MGAPTMFTIGHSTRPQAEFEDLLAQAGVRLLVDVRSVPRSRRNPQFEGDALARSLPAAGIAYRHAARLGGFRRPRPDSPNTGWEHRSFRGYADYMATAEFRAALDEVQREGRERPACVMCAETQWWRCHRRLIADALVVGGWRVVHLGLGATPAEHELTPSGVVDGASITYPPAQQELPVG